MPGATGRARGACVQGQDQAGRLSRAEIRRAAVRLLGSGACAAVAALGRLGMGKRQTLDRGARNLEMQLAPAHGKLGGSVASLLVARRYGPSGPNRRPIRGTT